MEENREKWYTVTMLSNGIDGIRGGGGGYVPPGRSGGLPAPGGPDGPNDGGDDRKKTVGKKDASDTFAIRSASETIAMLHRLHCGGGTYGPDRPPALLAIDTLNLLGESAELTDDDRAKLAELRKAVVTEQALRIHRHEQEIGDVRGDIREEVAAALAGIIVLLSQVQPLPDDPPSGDDGSVKAPGDAQSGGMDSRRGGREQGHSGKDGNDKSEPDEDASNDHESPSPHST